jgi:hypothetical protein
MSVTVEKIGRRHYLRNTPFSAKDRIKGAGCRWDPDQKAWWTGKAEIAESLLKSISGSSNGSSSKPNAPGVEATVAGRASYKGKTYYVAGRVEREWNTSVYDEEVSPVMTRDRSKYLLYFRDGSSQFWADATAVQIVKWYERPKTIRGLQEFAEKAKAEKAAGTWVDPRDIPEGCYVRDGEVLMRGCYECSQLGTMCESCRFDEYDC